MKICIFTNHFYPEDFKVNDIAFELANKGHSISVVTAVPDYPKGSFFPGYGIFRRCREMVNQCKVYRLPIIPRGKGSAVRLVINYISFFLSSSVFTFFHKYFHKYDAVFVHLTSPFFIGTCAAKLKKWQKIPMIFWVLDLWPESLTAAAGITNSLILKPQIKMVKKVYSCSDKILIGSKGFEKSICQKGGFHQKLEYFPNWAESVDSFTVPAKNYQTDFLNSFESTDFVILFAGNLGESQNLDCVLDVAVELRDIKSIKFVFIGDGRARAHLVNRVQENAITNTVFFPGRFPLEYMPYFMSKADVLLVSLKDEPIFNLTVPSKVQFYMAQGKPILAMLNGDGYDLVTEAQCGISVPANNKTAFMAAITKLSKMNSDELKTLGANGKLYYQNNFTKEQRIEQLCTILDNMNSCKTYTCK